MPRSHQNSLVCVYAQKGLSRLSFFCPFLLVSDENLALLHFFANAGIIFAYILVFPACAIEVQHSRLKTFNHIATFSCFHSTASDLIDAVQLMAATCSYPGHEVVVLTSK